MKFNFSLQKVMDHRKVLQDLAQKDFQDASEAHRQQVLILERMEQDTHNAHLRAGDLTQQGGAQGPALVQIHEFLKGQKIRIEIQKTKIKEAENLVEAKREILRQANQEYKIIEKIKENKRQIFIAEQESKDQKETDEQNILRFKSMKES